jgi:hypothetical protein
MGGLNTGGATAGGTGSLDDILGGLAGRPDDQAGR